MLATLTREQLLALVQDLDKDAHTHALIASHPVSQSITPASAMQQEQQPQEQEEEMNGNNTKPQPATKVKRDFDINKYRKRMIAIQIQYEGGGYYGFASQLGECDETIEKHLFDALLKLKLIDSRENCQYSRCGRTDRGVSALGQVISLQVRSSIPLTNKQTVASSTSMDSMEAEQEDVVLPNHPSESCIINGKSYKEMDYCHMLNRVLPPAIRALGWTAVSSEFNARFSAGSRTYRYFFLQQQLNISAMQEAVGHLIGSHDFRNFCKMDVANVSNFVREIYSAEIKVYQTPPLSSNNSNNNSNNDSSQTVWMLEITGIAFLWHMIRCIMAVLFMVGEQQETPLIVPFLLDVNNSCKSKPSYLLANELPLVLHACAFDKMRIDYQAKTLWMLTSHYHTLMETQLIAFARAKNSLEFLSQQRILTSDVLLLLEELDSKRSRTQARNTNNSHKNKSNNGSDQQLTTVGVKRKQEDNEQGVATTTSSSSSSSSVTLLDNKVDMLWSEALSFLQQQHNHIPRENTSPHIPLHQRKTDSDYSAKVENLQGKKKERYDRHVSLQQGERDPEFFTKMRQQGNL